MTLHRRTTSLWLLFLGLVVLLVVLLWPQPADAQCGTQASSCKNCHEVQAQDPVNSEGDWHVSHAFGDFCEFCHAGNVQSLVKEEAHVGMVYPLDDLDTNCLSCHPNDVQEKAQVYAVALGVTVGSGATGSTPPTGGDSGSAEPAAPAPTPAPETSAPAAEPATGGEIIDYNSQYTRTVEQQKEPVNMGNVILIILFVALSGLGVLLIWRWEGLGDKWRELRGAPAAASTAGVGTLAAAWPQIAPTPKVAARPQPIPTIAADERPEVAAVLTHLRAADAETLQALARLLERPQPGYPIIQAIARLDPRLVAAVRQLPAAERELLMALVREMES
ncbi:MAG: hypothetical protein AB1791_00500 [Chloroflexota bacterium]